MNLSARDLATALHAHKEGNGWKASCPAHDENTPSLHISEGESGVVVKCFGGCSQEKVIAALKFGGLWSHNGTQNGTSSRGVTLQQFADLKRLPIEFLREHGVSEFTGKYDNPNLKFTYFTSDGQPAPRYRIRYALKGGNKFCWDSESKERISLYGLNWLKHESVALLVEGESDVLTAVFHQINVIGFPGASTTKLLRADVVGGLEEVIISQEPGEAGEKFHTDLVERLKKHKFAGLIRALRWPDTIKDISNLHCNEADFDAAYAKLVEQAEVVSLPKSSSRGEENPARVADYERNEQGTLWIISKWNNEKQDYEDVAIPIANFHAEVTQNVIRDDGSRNVTRDFVIRAQRGDEVVEGVRIPAKDFTQLGWVPEHLGSTFIIFTGKNFKDRVRESTQHFSTKTTFDRVFLHSGWRKFEEGYGYLHAGGALGLENKEVHVELPRGLEHLNFQPIAGVPDYRIAIRAVYDLFDLAAPRISSLFSCLPWRAVFDAIDFAPFLVGHTGTFKTETGTLLQQHFGAGFTSRRPPLSWCGDTENYILERLFIAQNMLCLIDDYRPPKDMIKRSKLLATVERVIRAVANGAGRGRLNPNATAREQRPARGSTLSTGEELPQEGASLAGRIWAVEIRKRDIDVDKLTACQANATNGSYAVAMGLFIKWIVQQGYENTRDELTQRVLALRSEFVSELVSLKRLHPRVPGMVADLLASGELFLKFALSLQVITEEEALQRKAELRMGLLETAKAQKKYQEDQDPARRFIELLQAAIGSGAAHIATLAGNAPTGDEINQPATYGWRMDPYEKWQPQGKRVGWLDGVSIYLDPDTCHQLFKNEIPLNRAALGEELKARGYLHLIRMNSSGKSENRVRAEGRQMRPWDLKKAMLLSGIEEDEEEA